MRLPLFAWTSFFLFFFSISFSNFLAFLTLCKASVPLGLLLLFFGLGVLENFDGTDGLTIADLPDIVILQGVAKCLVIPPRIIVRKSLSKASHQYMAFITSEGTKQLLAYLNARLANGNPLNADSAIIEPDLTYKYGRGKKP